VFDFKKGSDGVALVNSSIAPAAALFYDKVLPISDNHYGYEEDLGIKNSNGWVNLVINLLYDIGSTAMESYADEMDLMDSLEAKLGSEHKDVKELLYLTDNHTQLFRDRYLLPIIKDYLEGIGHKNIIPVFEHGFPKRPVSFPKDYRYESNQSPEILLELSRPSFDGYPSLYSLSESHNDIIFEITIKSGKFIDVSKLEWEHVMEMRKDKDLIKKLRNFHLFIDEELSGKSRNYIEDKLSQKLDEYDQITKTQGLSLIETSYSSLVDSSSSIGTVAATSMALLSGHPELASILGAGGAIVSIGGAALKVKAKKQEYNNLTNSHAMAYLIGLDKRNIF